ncbi:MAG: amidohydrolase [Promethearchaeia archaeon]|nr:MAG: amidohydrolase [Candidatus Lokiarchaeia archaeon]
MEPHHLKKELITASRNLQNEIVAMRRYLHQHPELLFQEHDTQAYIMKNLQKWGYKPEKTAGTGVITQISGEKGGPIIALRADMDALAIHEENELEFKSLNPGVMHACGHDAHMACLLSAAQIIAKFRNHLHGTVKIIFQPGEEGGGGAKKIVTEGHLDNVDQVFGIHMWSPIYTGVIGLNPGLLMASADMFRITIKGKGGHAAFPYLSIDPTIVVHEIYEAFQKLITREINPLHTALITTPEFHGSKAGNIIPSTAILSGTLRTFDLKDQKNLLSRMREISELYAKAWRCESSFELLGVSYPPVVNSKSLSEKIKPILQDIGAVTEVEPSMGGEDFAFYQQKTDGVFLFLGIQNPKKKIIYPHHHPKFDVDEDVLWKGCAIYALLAFLHSL